MEFEMWKKIADVSRNSEGRREAILTALSMPKDEVHAMIQERVNHVMVSPVGKEIQ
jgi:hypothetical protein